MPYINQDKNSFVIEVNETYITSSRLKERLKYLFDLLKEFVDEKLSQKRNKKNIEELIEDVKQSFDELDEILMNIEFFNEEYQYFQDIKLISSYLLENKHTLTDNIPLISKMTKLFIDIINKKTITSEENYNKFYIEFIKNFNKCKEIFYTEVYSPSEEYNPKELSKIIYNTFKMEEE